MSRVYQLTRIADNDLTKIWHDTCEHWGAKQADKYLTELESCFIELTQHPELPLEALSTSGSGTFKI